MSNELKIRSALSREALPAAGAEQALYALIEVRAGGNAVPGTMPANFGLVLDRSGSMDGEKMENPKEAVGYVTDRLSDADLLSVTIFDDQVETLVPGQPAGNRDAVKEKISRVIPRGGTQISDGLRAGLEEVKKGFSPGRVNRVLLLTDGQTWDDEDACLRLAGEAARQGIAITTVGIGAEWNEKLLLRIAEQSRGNSHWIENPIAVLDAFRQEVEGMQSVTAVNVRLTAKLAPGVKPVKVYTTVPMIADVSAGSLGNGTVSAKLGSLDGKRGQVVLLELRVAGHKPGMVRIGDVEVFYDAPSPGAKSGTVKADLAVTFTADAAAATKVNAEVMNLAEKVSAFKLQTRALTEAEAGNIEAATRKLQAAATVLLNMGEEDLARAAEQEITALRKTGSLTQTGTKKLEYGTRKLTQVLTEAMK